MYSGDDREKPIVPKHARSFPDIEKLLETVSEAARNVASRDEKIALLTTNQREAQSLLGRLQGQAREVVKLQKDADERAKSASRRADEAEAEISKLTSRTQELEADLTDALIDLGRLAEAITGSSQTVTPPWLGCAR